MPLQTTEHQSFEKFDRQPRVTNDLLLIDQKFGKIEISKNSQNLKHRGFWQIANSEVIARLDNSIFPTI